jgi:hypothetical protein
MDGQAAREGSPGNLASLGVMIEDRFRKPASVDVAGTDEKYVPLRGTALGSVSIRNWYRVGCWHFVRAGMLETFAGTSGLLMHLGRACNRRIPLGAPDSKGFAKFA